MWENQKKREGGHKEDKEHCHSAAARYLRTWWELRRHTGGSSGGGGARCLSYLVSSACSQSIVLLLTDLLILIWVYNAAGGRHSLIFCLITHWDSLPPADTCPAATPVGPSVLLLLLQTAGAAEEGSRWTCAMSTPQCALYCVFDQYIIMKQEVNNLLKHVRC